MKMGYVIATEAPDNYPALFRGDLYRNIEIAADLGADTVELHFPDPRQVDGKAVARFCKQHGLSVSAMGTGLACEREHLSLTHTDPAIRKKTAERLIDFMDLARELDCLVLLAAIRGVPGNAESHPQYKADLVQALKEMAIEAEKRCVKLCMEPLTRYDLPLLNNAADMLALVKQVNSSAVGLNLDIYHMNFEESDINNAIRNCAGYILHFHISDNNRGYPGSAMLDLKSAIHELKELNYQGSVSMECLPDPDPLTAATMGLAYLKRLNEE